MTETLYTIAEVARMLKRSERAVYGLISRGVLKAVRVGKRLYVRAEDLKKAVKER